MVGAGAQPYLTPIYRGWVPAKSRTDYALLVIMGQKKLDDTFLRPRSLRWIFLSPLYLLESIILESPGTDLCMVVCNIFTDRNGSVTVRKMATGEFIIHPLKRYCIYAHLSQSQDVRKASCR